MGSPYAQLKGRGDGRAQLRAGVPASACRQGRIARGGGGRANGPRPGAGAHRACAVRESCRAGPRRQGHGGRVRGLALSASLAELARPRPSTGASRSTRSSCPSAATARSSALCRWRCRPGRAGRRDHRGDRSARGPRPRRRAPAGRRIGRPGDRGRDARGPSGRGAPAPHLANRGMIWLLVIVLVFILLISSFMSARISQPIKRLKKSMEMVEKGTF